MQIIPITVEQINTLGAIIADIRERNETSGDFMPWADEQVYDDVLEGLIDFLESGDYSAEIIAAVRNNI